ncbi:unnamed protein product [Amoebophrya sp. A120]|nr:unnamed protein product [Amoebophrya sp. A120]|eukprot:GSA120T00008356001.1
MDPHISPFLQPQPFGANEVVVAPFATRNLRFSQIRKFPFRNLPHPSELQELRDHIRKKAEEKEFGKKGGGSSASSSSRKRKQPSGAAGGGGGFGGSSNKRRPAAPASSSTRRKNKPAGGGQTHKNHGSTSATSPRRPQTTPANGAPAMNRSLSGSSIDPANQSVRSWLQFSPSLQSSQYSGMTYTNNDGRSFIDPNYWPKYSIHQSEFSRNAPPYDTYNCGRSLLNAHLLEQAVQPRPMTQQEYSRVKWGTKAIRTMTRKGKNLGLLDSQNSGVFTEWLRYKQQTDRPDWYDRHHLTYANDGKIQTMREYFDRKKTIPDEQLDYVIRTRQNRYKFEKRPWTEGNCHFFPEPPSGKGSRPTVTGALRSDWQDVATTRKNLVKNIERETLLGDEVNERRFLTAIAARDALDAVDPELGRAKPGTAPGNLLSASTSTGNGSVDWRDDFVRLESRLCNANHVPALFDVIEVVMWNLLKFEPEAMYLCKICNVQPISTLVVVRLMMWISSVNRRMLLFCFHLLKSCVAHTAWSGGRPVRVVRG